jgi:hypothetical protein
LPIFLMKPSGGLSTSCKASRTGPRTTTSIDAF